MESAGERKKKGGGGKKVRRVFKLDSQSMAVLKTLATVDKYRRQHAKLKLSPSRKSGSRGIHSLTLPCVLL